MFRWGLWTFRLKRVQRRRISRTIPSALGFTRRPTGRFISSSLSTRRSRPPLREDSPLLDVSSPPLAPVLADCHGDLFLSSHGFKGILYRGTTVSRPAGVRKSFHSLPLPAGRLAPSALRYNRRGPGFLLYPGALTGRLGPGSSRGLVVSMLPRYLMSNWVEPEWLPTLTPMTGVPSVVASPCWSWVHGIASLAGNPRTCPGSPFV